jgi:hypothetical protein
LQTRQQLKLQQQQQQKMEENIALTSPMHASTAETEGPISKKRKRKAKTAETQPQPSSVPIPRMHFQSNAMELDVQQHSHPFSKHEVPLQPQQSQHAQLHYEQCKQSAPQQIPPPTIKSINSMELLEFWYILRKTEPKDNNGFISLRPTSDSSHKGKFFPFLGDAEHFPSQIYFRESYTTLFNKLDTIFNTSALPLSETHNHQKSAAMIFGSSKVGLTSASLGLLYFWSLIDCPIIYESRKLKRRYLFTDIDFSYGKTFQENISYIVKNNPSTMHDLALTHDYFTVAAVGGLDDFQEYLKCSKTKHIIDASGVPSGDLFCDASIGAKCVVFTEPTHEALAFVASHLEQQENASCSTAAPVPSLENHGRKVITMVLPCWTRPELRLLGRMLTLTQTAQTPNPLPHSTASISSVANTAANENSNNIPAASLSTATSGRPKQWRLLHGHVEIDWDDYISPHDDHNGEEVDVESKEGATQVTGFTKKRICNIFVSEESLEVIISRFGGDVAAFLEFRARLLKEFENGKGADGVNNDKSGSSGNSTDNGCPPESKRQRLEVCESSKTVDLKSGVSIVRNRFCLTNRFHSGVDVPVHGQVMDGRAGTTLEHYNLGPPETREYNAKIRQRREREKSIMEEFLKEHDSNVVGLLCLGDAIKEKGKVKGKGKADRLSAEKSVDASSKADLLLEYLEGASVANWEERKNVFDLQKLYPGVFHIGPCAFFDGSTSHETTCADLPESTSVKMGSATFAVPLTPPPRSSPPKLIPHIKFASKYVGYRVFQYLYTHHKARLARVLRMKNMFGAVRVAIRPTQQGQSPSEPAIGGGCVVGWESVRSLLLEYWVQAFLCQGPTLESKPLVPRPKPTGAGVTKTTGTASSLAQLPAKGTMKITKMRGKVRCLKPFYSFQELQTAIEETQPSMTSVPARNSFPDTSAILKKRKTQNSPFTILSSLRDDAMGGSVDLYSCIDGSNSVFKILVDPSLPKMAPKMSTDEPISNNCVSVLPQSYLPLSESLARFILEVGDPAQSLGVYFVVPAEMFDAMHYKVDFLPSQLSLFPSLNANTWNIYSSQSQTAKPSTKLDSIQNETSLTQHQKASTNTLYHRFHGIKGLGKCAGGWSDCGKLLSVGVGLTIDEDDGGSYQQAQRNLFSTYETKVPQYVMKLDLWSENDPCGVWKV